MSKNTAPPKRLARTTTQVTHPIAHRSKPNTGKNVVLSRENAALAVPVQTTAETPASVELVSHEPTAAGEAGLSSFKDLEKPELDSQDGLRPPSEMEGGDSSLCPPASSTPIREGVCRPTSVSQRLVPSELRIQAQIRQARAAGTPEVPIQQDTEPLEPEVDDCDSDASVNSCDSTRTVDGRRVVLSEMPRQAGACLQKAKLELEKSGNLKREIKENVVSALHLMYEMVLKLSDSRNLHMTEAHRVKSVIAKDRERNAQRHARALETALGEYKKLEDRIERLSLDTEALRQILLFDACEPIKTLKHDTELALRQSPQIMSSVLAKVAEMSAELEPLRAALQSLQPPDIPLNSEPASKQGPDMFEVREELAHIRRELESLTQRRAESATGEIFCVDDLRMAVQEAMLGTPNLPPTNITDMQEVLAKCNDTREAVADVQRGLLILEKALPQSDSAEVLGSKMEELRRDVKTLQDTTVETAAPIRTSVEHIRGLIETRSTDVVQRPTGHRENQGVQTSLPEHHQPVKSYAEALNTPSHSLIVESVDPRHTSDDVIKTIKSRVDVVELGVGINSIRKLRNQKVSIGCASEHDRAALSEAIRGTSEGFTVLTPTPKNPHIRLLGVINDLDNKSIETAIVKQNSNLLDGLQTNNRQIKVIRRTKGRTAATTNVVLEVDTSLWQRLNGQRIKLGFQVVAALDQSPVVQCYNCLGFGHLARDCQSQVACGYCSEGHDTRDCPNRSSVPKCVNCAKSRKLQSPLHPAYSSECPEWSKWDRISRAAVRYC